VYEYVRAVLGVLAVMDPLGAVAIFYVITAPLTKREQRRAAALAVGAALAILTGAVFAGEIVMRSLGIGIDALRISGGIIVGWMGFSMLDGTPSSLQLDQAERRIHEQILVPFAMPLLAGPGSITTVMTLTVHANGGWPVAALTAVGISCAVTLAVLLISIEAKHWIGEGVQRVFTRFLGLVLIALGVEFVLAGVKAAFGVDA